VLALTFKYRDVNYYIVRKYYEQIDTITLFVDQILMTTIFDCEYDDLLAPYESDPDNVLYLSRDDEADV
jgi:hypothetical protein